MHDVPCITVLRSPAVDAQGWEQQALGFIEGRRLLMSSNSDSVQGYDTVRSQGWGAEGAKDLHCFYLSIKITASVALSHI